MKIRKSMMQNIIKEEVAKLSPRQKRILREKLIKESDIENEFDEIYKLSSKLETKLENIRMYASDDPRGGVSKQQITRLNQAYTQFMNTLRKIANEIG